MKIYITRINGGSLHDKTHFIQHMTAELAHQLDCREMGIYRYFLGDESWESLSSRLDGIIAGINKGDFIIYQFPTGNGMRFENELINRLKAYGGRITIFVQEILACEENQVKREECIALFNKAEVLIVPTYAMRQWLLENGIHKSMKFVIQEMWDYTVKDPLIKRQMFRKELYFTDSEGFEGMNSWKYSVPLKLYNVSANQGEKVENLGEREPYELLFELNKAGGFGLVWYRDAYSRQYMEKSNSFSLARYLAAGMPVIVPAGCSHQMLIEENHLGIAVNHLEEAAAVVEQMTEEDYQGYVQSVEQFAPALRSGSFTRKCLLEAMLAFYRKDAGRLPVPESVYEVGKGMFRSAVFNEAYGGNLAFSWDFQGKVDGFLIYDISGIILGNIQNYHEHYFLLKEKERENGFIIKAYVQTLKGRLIVAEAGPVYLQKRNYGEPKVSLIMPAYNAEDYIARSIDTVLAQTFNDFEIIIVNDGSTDRTQAVIDWYADRYPNVKSFYQSNGGQASARNTGIKYSSGNYIGFMDNDDMIRPDMLGRLYEVAIKNNCDISMTSVYQLTGEGYQEMNVYPLAEDEAISVDAFFECYMGSLSPVIWNKLYCASLVKEHLFATGVTFEDDAWTPYVLSYAGKVCYINAHLYEYDRTIRNVTGIHASWSKPIEEKFLDHREFVLFFLKNGNQEKKVLLKRLALSYLGAFMSTYSYPKYKELKEEIERM